MGPVNRMHCHRNQICVRPILALLSVSSIEPVPFVPVLNCCDATKVSITAPRVKYAARHGNENQRAGHVDSGPHSKGDDKESDGASCVQQIGVTPSWRKSFDRTILP